jgi:hypothetical protein
MCRLFITMGCAQLSELIATVTGVRRRYWEEVRGAMRKISYGRTGSAPDYRTDIPG